MPDDVIISADSHMTEPPDLWVERIDKPFRDRAPRGMGIGTWGPRPPRRR